VFLGHNTNMRPRVLLWISVGVNLVLGGAWYYFAHSHPMLLRPKPDAVAFYGTPTRQVLTHTVVRQQFFAWNQIESPNYVAFIANLRDIGCPESTIRDIIVAEINLLYAQKRANEIVLPDQQWWRTEPDPKIVRAAADKLNALDAERRALLARLLGPNWDDSANAWNQSSDALVLTGPLLGNLTPEQRQTVLNITTQATQRQQAYLLAQQEAGKSGDPAELARLRQQTREELARVLNPDQLQEYMLRYSSTANGLRSDLQGTEVTADEFRRLFSLRDAIEQQPQLYYGGDDAQIVKRRQELEQQRTAVLTQVLGAERTILLQLQRDPLFYRAQAAVAQNNASPEAIMPIYQINQASELERQRIRNDLTLTDEERDAALEIIQEEQDESLQRILRSDKFKKSATPAAQ
jgi:hypothetical protein